MTEEEAKNDVTSYAQSLVGTHETGDNFTTFAQDADARGWTMRAYGFTMQGKAWCDFFVDYCFWKRFGFETGQKMLYQDGKTGGAACMNSASFFRAVNSWHGTPEVGDQVIYAGENHTGLVVAVYSNGSFDAVDGNYSDAVTKRKGLFPSATSGFGRPDWSLVSDINADTKESTETKTDTTTETTTEEFKAGDAVSIKAGAVYYNGGNIPARYFTKQWIVLQCNGDRAVLNDSVDGTITGWMSPINIKYLTKVGNTSTIATENIAQTTIYGTGVQSAIAEQITQNSYTSPVILSNTSTTVHAYGGRKNNVKE